MRESYGLGWAYIFKIKQVLQTMKTISCSRRLISNLFGEVAENTTAAHMHQSDSVVLDRRRDGQQLAVAAEADVVGAGGQIGDRLDRLRFCRLVHRCGFVKIDDFNVFTHSID